MSTDNQESTDITGNTDRQGNEPPPPKKKMKKEPGGNRDHVEIKKIFQN